MKQRWLMTVLLFGLLGLLAGCERPAPAPDPAPDPTPVETAAAEPASAETAPNIVQSPNDERDYDYRRLSNGLQVVLVSDPDAKKSAASLDVFVGSAHDPEDRPGLAHFLEHMLFLGTEKYPEPDEYQAYIAAHGGSHNAYTSYEHTNYFFDINSPHFPEALDRFAQFFIAPLFNAEYVEREKHAVESEYHARIQSEARRTVEAFQQVVNPAHSFNRFSIGNLETLADRPNDPVREDLLAFYRRYYAAEQMTLTVVSDRPLPALRELVTPLFSDVPARERSRALPDEPLFTDGTLPARLNVVPQQDRRELTLVFPVADVLPHYRTKPLDYIGFLLGHEGEGSLLAWLKARGWADSINAGVGLNFTNASTFQVDVTLTEAGLDHVETVVTRIFQTLNRIREAGPEVWRYAEQQRMANLNFRFMEKSEPAHYAMRLANNLHYYPVAEVIRGDYLMEALPAEAIRDYLSQLTPDNALVVVNAPELDTDATTRWFHTDYKVVPLASAARLARWREAGTHEAIVLPEPNPYLPSSTALHGPAAEAAPTPTRLAERDGVEAWYALDTRFGVPRGVFRVRLAAPDRIASARDAALMGLYARVLSDNLNTVLYPARMAGLGVSVSDDLQGLSLSVTGFDQRQPKAVRTVVAAMRDVAVDPVRFQALKAEWSRALANSRLDMPYRRLIAKLRAEATVGQWDDAALRDALRPLTVEDLRAYAPDLASGWRLEVLAYGNYTRNTAEALLEALAPLTRDAPPAVSPRVVRLTSGARRLTRTPSDHKDTGVLLTVQPEDASLRSRALMALAGDLLRPPYFNELRTERQMGYVVAAADLPVQFVPMLAFIVQSPAYDVRQILTATRSLWDDVPSLIDESRFRSHRDALIRELEEPAKNLSEQADRHWRAYTQYRDRSFTHRRQLARTVAAIDYADWQAFFADTVRSAEARQWLFYAPGERGVDEDALTREWRGAAETTGVSAGGRYFRWDDMSDDL